MVAGAACTGAGTPLAAHMCPLGPQRHHGAAAGRARGRPFGTEKISTFFAVARNFVCTPVPFFPDRETTIEHLFATARLSEQGGTWVTKKFPPSGTL